MFIIVAFWLGCVTPSGLIFFVTALLLSILTPLFLPSSSVFLSYFILAVPMRECLGKHLCTSSPFPIAILNGTFYFRQAKKSLLWQKLRLSKSNRTTTTATVLFQGISQGMWLFAWEFLVFSSVLPLAYAFLFHLLLLLRVIDARRLSWFTKILLWISLLLSTEVKNLITLAI